MVYDVNYFRFGDFRKDRLKVRSSVYPTFVEGDDKVSLYVVDRFTENGPGRPDCLIPSFLINFLRTEHLIKIFLNSLNF